MTRKRFELLHSGAVQLTCKLYFVYTVRKAYPSGHAVEGVGLRLHACLLRLQVSILPGAWMSVSCECCVLSGRGLCDGPITCPEESYQVWYVSEVEFT